MFVCLYVLITNCAKATKYAKSLCSILISVKSNVSPSSLDYTVCMYVSMSVCLYCMPLYITRYLSIATKSNLIELNFSLLFKCMLSAAQPLLLPTPDHPNMTGYTRKSPSKRRYEGSKYPGK